MNLKFQKYAPRLNGYRYYLISLPVTVGGTKHSLSAALEHQLTVDCWRSLSAYECFTGDLKRLYRLYLERVLDAFELLEPEVSAEYLYGVLDILEAPFIALSFPHSVKKARLSAILAEILRRVYNESRFSIYFYVQHAAHLAQMLYLPVDCQLAEIQLLKVSITQGMHCTSATAFHMFMSWFAVSRGLVEAIDLAGQFVRTAALGAQRELVGSYVSEFEYFTVLWRHFDVVCQQVNPEMPRSEHVAYSGAHIYMPFIATAIALLLIKR